MRHVRQYSLYLLGLFLLALLYACSGSGSTNTPSTTAGGSSAGSGSTGSGSGGSGSGSSGTGSGSGGSGSGSGSGGSGSGSGSGSNSTPDNFLAHMSAAAGRNTFYQDRGVVTLDTKANDGTGQLQYLEPQGSLPETGLQLRFCPYPKDPNVWSNCTVLATFNTDGMNTAVVPFTFPKGTFSGGFEIVTSGNQVAPSSPEWLSGAITADPSVTYQGALLPAQSITAGVGGTTGKETGYGSFSFAGTTLTYKVSGAKPTNQYNVQFCQYQGTCTSLGLANSDGSGNLSGTASLQSQSAYYGVIELTDAQGIEYITGWRVN